MDTEESVTHWYFQNTVKLMMYGYMRAPDDVPGR